MSILRSITITSYHCMVALYSSARSRTRQEDTLPIRGNDGESPVRAELPENRVTIDSLFAAIQAVQGRRMKPLPFFLFLLVLLILLVTFSAPLPAQGNQVVRGADDRYKADILVVVAHPDDEGFFTPYL